MSQTKLWTREELIVAFNLYLKLPFGKLHSRTKEIIELAQLIGRTANSVAMRLNNYAAVDPYHQNRGIGGLPGGFKQVKPIFDEFINNKEELIYESEKLLAQFEKKPLEEKYADELKWIEFLAGEDRKREVKTRVNQQVFRQMVLANYNYSCAVSGINIPDFLVASHIVPWSVDTENRLNPENGLCLSSLYDKAFDKGFITLSKEYRIEIADSLKSKATHHFYDKFFAPYAGKPIQLPKKYLPSLTFLEYHHDVVFKK